MGRLEQSWAFGRCGRPAWGLRGGICTCLEASGRVFQTGFWKKQASLPAFLLWYRISACRWGFCLLICLFLPSGWHIPQVVGGLRAGSKTGHLKHVEKNNRTKSHSCFYYHHLPAVLSNVGDKNTPMRIFFWSKFWTNAAVTVSITSG